MSNQQPCYRTSEETYAKRSAGYRYQYPRYIGTWLKVQIDTQKTTKLPAARSSDRVLKQRKERIEEWEAIPELDYGRNCVYIDVTGFNLHTQRNYGHSRKGTPAKSIVPTAKGITITILGAISQAGVIDISLRKP